MARACSPTDREAHRGLPSWQEKEQKSAAPRVGAGRGGGAAVAATAMTSAPSPALPGKTRDSESAFTAPVIMGVQQWNREAGSWLPARAASRTQPQGLLVGEKKDQEEIDGTKVPEQNIPEKKEEYNSNKRRRYKDRARVEATLEGGQDAMPDEFLSEHSNSTTDAELLEAGPSAAATAAPCVAMPPHPATSTSPPASSLPPPTPPPPPPTAATRRGPMSPKMRTSKTKGSASLKRSWPRPSRRPRISRPSGSPRRYLLQMQQTVALQHRSRCRGWPRWRGRERSS